MTQATMANIKKGDRLRGFEGFGCIPDKATRIIQYDDGFYVRCKRGRHYLDGQADDGHVLVGLTKCPA